MKRAMAFSTGLLVAALATAPAIGQLRGEAPHLGAGSLNPSLSLSAPATTPLQAQVQNDAAARLQAEQRDLLQLNPAGDSRQQLAIGHDLNSFTPR